MSGSATTTMYWSSETISMAKDSSARVAVSPFHPRLPGADDVSLAPTTALLTTSCSWLHRSPRNVGGGAVWSCRPQMLILARGTDIPRGGTRSLPGRASTRVAGLGAVHRQAVRQVRATGIIESTMFVLRCGSGQGRRHAQ